MSPILRPWPYATKAIIEHQFDTNHIHVWVIFRFSMKTSIKPPDNLWLCKVNTVLKPVSASAWQDEWTLLLTVPNIAALPDSVTLAYNGPNANLRIRWNKMWEPFGPILSHNAIPFPFGSFKGNEINWQQVAAQATWYTISDPDITEGQTQDTIFQNNQELKIQKAGYYLINYYVSIEVSIANKHVLAAPSVNGTPQPDGQTHHEFGRANEESSLAASAILILAVNDLVSVAVATGDAGNPTLTVQHVGLTLLQTLAA